MSRTRYLLGRLGFVIIAAYGLLSVTFFFVALTPDPNEAFVQMAAAMGGGDTEAALEGYRAARNRNVPLAKRYVGWLIAYTTLDWGNAQLFVGGESHSVTELIRTHGIRSLAYVIPGLTLAAIGGVAMGVWNAVRPHSLAARLAVVGAVVLGAVPSYYLGYLLAKTAVDEFELLHFYDWSESGVLAASNLPNIFLAAITLAAALIVVQVRYVRSGTSEFVRTEAAKLVRMKGGRDRDVIRHALRVLGGSIVTLFLTEAVTVLFLAMYVIEAVFSIPGFGHLSLQAINARDVPLILGTTMVPVLIGLLGLFLQDLVEVALDPRVE
jgi:peptide/nickel transport system permease protein